jgi:hypothetical protein
MSLVDTQALVDDLVRDKDQVIASGSRDSAIVNAVARYSIDAPRVLVDDLVSDGTQRLDTPTEWVVGQSSLRALEYPIGNIPTTLLDAAAISLYDKPDGTQQFTLLFVPLVGDTLRATFTAPQLLDDTHDTIPPRHARAVACLAASDLCGQLSAYYATEGSPTITADVTDHQGKTDRFRKRAADLLAEYIRIVGVAPADRVRPASADANPQRTDVQGRARLFHPVQTWPGGPA